MLSESRTSLRLTGKRAQSGVSSDPRAALLFAGDFFLRAGKVQVRTDLLDESLQARVQECSVAVLNFEGPIPGPASQPIPKAGPHLAMDAQAARVAKDLGFRAVTLANNHSMDYGADGLKNTLEAASAQGLETVGAGLTGVCAAKPLRVTLPGNQRVQILSFCEREFGTSQNGSAGAAWLHSPDAEDAVRTARSESDVVIVCAHGGNELMPLPSVQRRSQLRRLIEAGADLVIGHHPHVPQGWEEWRGGTIFYSLGDFYFDALDGRRATFKDWGYLVQVRMVSKHVEEIEIVPFERVDDRIVPLGTARDGEAHLCYLENLAAITAGETLPAYWQTLAVDRMLRGYTGNLLALVPWKRTVDSSAGMRIRETLRRLAEVRALWKPKYFGSSRGPKATPRDLQGKTLDTLNLIRCESHNWLIETSLSVLTGESEDLRTAAVYQDLRRMAPFSGYNL